MIISFKDDCIVPGIVPVIILSFTEEEIADIQEKKCASIVNGNCNLFITVQPDEEAFEMLAKAVKINRIDGFSTKEAIEKVRK